MSTRPKTDRSITAWLEAQAPDRAPDRLLAASRDQIRITRQRRAWWPAWRIPEMNTYLKVAIGVAAVAVIAVVGINLLPRSDSGVGGTPSTAPSAAPSPAPTASAGPSASPSASAVFPPWFTADKGAGGAGILPAGSQTTRSFGPGFTFTVPEGWVNTSDGDIFELFPDSPTNQAEYARSGRIEQAIFMAGIDTPWLICEAAGGVNEGTTAAEKVDSLAANKAFATSEPVDVTIGGLSGRRVDYQLDPGWTGSCAPGPDDPPSMDYNDVRNRGIFLDTPDGVLLIIVDSLHSAGHEAFLAEAMPVIESFKFDTSK